jgi:alpha-D-xyloside xylohydrolase
MFLQGQSCDEGDGHGYEQGARAVIPIRWDESAGTLTLGQRVGSYPGMSREIGFNIFFVSEGHGSGANVSTQADKEIRYSGQSIQIVDPNPRH